MFQSCGERRRMGSAPPTETSELAGEGTGPPRLNVRTCNHCISSEGSHVSTIRNGGNYEILYGQILAARCRHWKDRTGMKEGFAQRFCISQFLRVCVVGKQNLRGILGANLTAYVFPALQHLARLSKLRMYYGAQICCGRWIISSVKSRSDYAEIPYGSSIFP